MPRNDQLAAAILRPPKVVDGKVDPKDWADFIRTLTNLDLRSGATGFNSGNGYFIGFDSDGFPCIFVGDASGKNLRYTAADGNLYIDKGAIIVDGTELKTLAYGVQTGTAYDGDVITFDPVFNDVPAVIMGDGGITYSGTLGAVDTQRILQAQDLTQTGFTMKAKLGDLGAPTARTLNFSNTDVSTIVATKTLAAEAYDDAYTANFVMTVEAGGTGIANVYTKSAAGSYVLRATVTKINGTAGTLDFSISQTVVVDGLDAGAQIKVETPDVTVTGTTVTYSENTITEVTATPAGSTGISWLAIGGT